MVNMVNGMTLAPVHNHVDSLEQKNKRDYVTTLNQGMAVKTVSINIHLVPI